MQCFADYFLILVSLILTGCSNSMLILVIKSGVVSWNNCLLASLYWVKSLLVAWLWWSWKSCMINGHETQWGRLGFIAMHEVKAVMTQHCWLECFLDWSQWPGRKVLLIESTAMCSWTRQTFKSEDISNDVWAGEGWALPHLHAQDMLGMT